MASLPRKHERLELPSYPMKPAQCLALPADLEESWVVEPKWRGWHFVVARQAGQIRFFTRHLKEITTWEGLQALREKLTYQEASDYQLVGELLPADGEQERVPSIRRGATATPVFFDVVMTVYPDAVLEVRREHLSRLGVLMVRREPIPSESWLLSFYESMKYAGREGVVLKRLGSRYTLSRVACVVTGDWLKIR